MAWFLYIFWGGLLGVMSYRCLHRRDKSALPELFVLLIIPIIEYLIFSYLFIINGAAPDPRFSESQAIWELLVKIYGPLFVFVNLNFLVALFVLLFFSTKDFCGFRSIPLKVGLLAALSLSVYHINIVSPTV